MLAKWTKFRHCKVIQAMLVFWMCWMFVHYGRLVTQTPHHIFINDFYSQPCNLPVLNAFDPSIKAFIWRPDPIECASFPSVVYVDEENVLRVNISALAYFSVKSVSEMICKAEPVTRTTHDDYHVLFEDSYIINFPAKLKSDFSRVRCKTGSKILFDNIVSGISEAVKRGNQPVKNETDEQLSVLLFGIDSVSRSASIRGMPKTLEYLKTIGSYDFTGMMKIGDNTPPNLIGILTGKKLYSNETPGFGGWMNDWPILWKNFSSKHYVTLYGEDVRESTFNLHDYKGFAEQPVDHYMRPFWLGLKQSEEDFNKGVLRLLMMQGSKLRTSDFCNQNTKKHNEIISYLKKFMLKYRKKRKFALTHLTNIAHENFNNLHHGDEDFRSFLQWLNDEGFLERTIVFFYSDHGARFEEIRNTFIGRMEARMPMVHILLPGHIKAKYPDIDFNLKRNTKRLLSHYDIHQTLVDILNGNYRKPSKQRVNGKTRGVSLFGEISATRSCMDAGIQADFCACYKSHPINITDNNELSKFNGGTSLVEHINNLLSEEPKCQKLKLRRIIAAEKLSLGLQHFGNSHNGYTLFKHLKPESGRVSYAIQLETEPGLARFEVSCELETGSNTCTVRNVDRINKYGNQSYCVTKERFRQYCYC